MAEGQFLGPRGSYVYTSDSGDSYVITTDATLGALTGCDLTAFNPASPGGATAAPKRFKPRGVYWKGTATGYEKARKFLICGTTDATLYDTTVGATLTIDGVAGVTTGRRGETLTFP